MKRHTTYEKCPALGVIWHKCKKRVKAQCLSKATATVETQVNVVYLGTLNSKDSTAWMATVCPKRQEIWSKMDTGTEVTTISEETYQRSED